MCELRTEQIKELISAAKQARKYAYIPYSGYSVGAALLVCDEKRREMVVTGCNIENAAFSPGNCAERTAVFKAISEGYKCLKAVAIVGGKGESLDMAYPCGMCRQVLREFADPKEFIVIIARSEEEYICKSLEELLPMSFGPDNLK